MEILFIIIIIGALFVLSPLFLAATALGFFCVFIYRRIEYRNERENPLIKKKTRTYLICSLVTLAISVIMAFAVYYALDALNDSLTQGMTYM